jgi:fructokinase
VTDDGKTVFGGIEAGGTKWVLAIGTDPDDLHALETIPTTTPAATLQRAAEFFTQNGGVSAVGVGSFGPIDHRSGHITTTPKVGWANTAVVSALRGALGVPIVFDTDVNAAALGEQRWGAAMGLDTFCYFTVGTGIGGGVMAGGRLVHGLLHPEVGHMLIPHDRTRDPFAGACPFHGDCFEGLASGGAIYERWGKRAEELGDRDEVWQLEAEYLALGVVNVICVLSPQRVILGGGVMKEPSLLPLVRSRTRELLGGYIAAPELLDGLDEYIVGPALGDRAGVLGAIELARLAHQS